MKNYSKNTLRLVKTVLPKMKLNMLFRSAVLSGTFFIVSGGDGRGVIVEKLLDASY